MDGAKVRGTGRGDRSTRDDGLKFLEAGQPTGTPAPVAAAPASAQSEEDEEHVALTPVRRMIAEAMGRTPGAIRLLHIRAKERLKQWFGSGSQFFSR